jgi:hypothetical protein
VFYKNKSDAYRYNEHKLKIEEIETPITLQKYRTCFNYLDELIDKKDNTEPRKKIGIKIIK